MDLAQDFLLKEGRACRRVMVLCKSLSHVFVHYSIMGHGPSSWHE